MQMQNSQALRKYCIAYLVLCVLNLSFLAGALKAEENNSNDPAELIKSKQVGFSTSLGTVLPKELPFTLQNGQTVTFGELLVPNTPTILVPLYFGCPRLCGLLTEGFLDLVRALNLKIGTEYNIVFLSFDPTEDYQLAAQKEITVFDAIQPIPATSENIRFITGSESSIKSLLDAAGFKYKFIAGEYIHSAGFFVLTPEGEISQYFTGIQFSPWDVRLAIIEASKGAIGSTVDHILLYCFDFDPTKGKYTWVAFNILRGGTMFAVVLFATVAVLLAKRIGSKKVNFS